MKLVKAVATTVYKLATDGKEPPVPLNVSAELVSNCIVFIVNSVGLKCLSQRQFISFHWFHMKPCIVIIVTQEHTNDLIQDSLRI